MVPILFVALIFLSSVAMADAPPFGGENEFRVTSILQGDAGTFTNRNGKQSGYFHLAGCLASSPDSSLGKAAKEHLKKIALNKIADFQFAKGVVGNIPDKHYLVVVEIAGKDVCASLIQKGLAMHREGDDSLISAVASGKYYIAQNSAKLSKFGMWGVGDQAGFGNFVEDPASRYELSDYKYRQKRINGIDDPSKAGFDRPPLPSSGRKDPNDWRTKVYK